MEVQILRYVFATQEIASWKHLSHWNRKEMKNKNPHFFIGRDQLCPGFTRKFWKSAENENYDISKTAVFAFFSSPKHEIYRNHTMWHFVLAKYEKRKMILEIIV